MIKWCKEYFRIIIIRKCQHVRLNGKYPMNRYREKYYYR